MKHLLPLALILAASSLCSCTLAGRLIQTPVRLIQAGVRTVTDVDEAEPPATAESARLHGLALRHVTAPEPSQILAKNPATPTRHESHPEPQRVGGQ